MKSKIIFFLTIILISLSAFYYFENYVSDFQKIQVSDFDLEIPKILNFKKVSKNEILINHSVPYRHADFCDLKDGKIIDNFTDYSNKIKIYNEKYDTAFRKEYFFMSKDVLDQNGNFKLSEGFVEKVKINKEKEDIYKITSGVEGCGTYTYIIPHKDKTVFLENDFIPPFNGAWTEETINEFKNIEGIIKPEEAESILEKILEQFI